MSIECGSWRGRVAASVLLGEEGASRCWENPHQVGSSAALDTCGWGRGRAHRQLLTAPRNEGADGHVREAGTG